MLSTLLLSLMALVARPDTATIMFAGDAMHHKQQIEAAARPGGRYDYSGYFSAVKPFISHADYAVVNLETPLGGQPYSGYPMFCAPDEYLDALTDAGFDLILAANNHTLDRRDNGIQRTIDQFEKRNVPYVGIYRDQAARDSILPLIRDINGFRVAFLNYTYGTNGMKRSTPVGLDYIDRTLMAKDISEARRKGAEIVAVCVHWGDEYHLLPNSSQRDLADFLKKQGADLIIGGHPHVIQPMEIFDADTIGRKGLLVYSLGNFISGMKKPDTRGGAVVTVTLARDSLGRPTVKGAEYSLVFVNSPVKYGDNFRLFPAESDSIAPVWRQQRDIFVRNAVGTFDKHNKGVGRKILNK
ncbi:MAG: CapA family protein [Bacteroides sp.]|nr:CapA family protein [Bacteroides sp.]